MSLAKTKPVMLLFAEGWFAFFAELSVISGLTRY